MFDESSEKVQSQCRYKKIGQKSTEYEKKTHFCNTIDIIANQAKITCYRYQTKKTFVNKSTKKLSRKLISSISSEENV